VSGTTPPAGPRPVTPVTILAAQLDRLVGALERVDGLDPALMTQMRDARALAAGLDPYLDECTTPESDALRALAQDTASTDWRREPGGPRIHLEQEMLSGHVEGQLLKVLVRATGARRVLEVGMFTGYSALAMAEALPADGEVVACELDPEVADFARRHFDGSPAGRRIRVEVGPADATLARLEAEDERFDLVFIDADKGGYLGYLHALLDGGLLAPDGLICVDNTLLQAEPYLDREPSANGAAIAEFNRAVAADPRVEQVMVPLRDGLTLIIRT